MKKLYVDNRLVALGDYVIKEVDENPKYKLKVVPSYNYERDKYAYWNEQTKFYFNHRGYRFDGEVDDELIEKMKNQSKNDRTRYYPVYCYEHSGISLYKYPYDGPDARWDSGMLGIAEVDNSNDDADEIFDDFFMELKPCMEGEVYGFQVLDELGDVVASCYGFYGESLVDSIYENIPSEYGFTKSDVEFGLQHIQY